MSCCKLSWYFLLNENLVSNKYINKSISIRKRKFNEVFAWKLNNDTSWKEWPSMKQNFLALNNNALGVWLVLNFWHFWKPHVFFANNNKTVCSCHDDEMHKVFTSLNKNEALCIYSWVNQQKTIYVSLMFLWQPNLLDRHLGYGSNL